MNLEDVKLLENYSHGHSGRRNKIVTCNGIFNSKSFSIEFYQSFLLSYDKKGLYDYCVCDKRTYIELYFNLNSK